MRNEVSAVKKELTAIPDKMRVVVGRVVPTLARE
jgi:hypothetical protein